MGPGTIRAAITGELPDPEATVRVPPPPAKGYYAKDAVEDYDCGAVEEIAVDYSSPTSDSDSARSDEGGIAIGPALLPVFQATAFGGQLERGVLPAHVVRRHRAALFITPQPRTLCPVTGALLLDVQLYNLAVLDLLVGGGYLTRPFALITAFRRASVRLVELLRRLGDAFALAGSCDDGGYDELERLKAGTMLLAGKVCQTAQRVMQVAT